MLHYFLDMFHKRVIYSVLIRGFKTAAWHMDIFPKLQLGGGNFTFLEIKFVNVN